MTLFFSKRFRILRESFLLVGLVLFAKLFLNFMHWEFLSTSSLMTSIISGGIFVLGFMLSSTHADYKESERLPIEITNAIESIYNDGVIFQKQYASFDFDRLINVLLNIISSFKQDLVVHSNDAHSHASDLSSLYLDLEKMGVPANYIVRLKQDQSIIMRALLRVNYLQRIQPIPSAFILVESIVSGLILILLFTRMDSLINELVSVGFISFIFIYMLKLIKVLEMPFHVEGSTLDDVSLFLLEEQSERIGRRRSSL